MEPRDIVSFPNGEIGVAWDDGHESIWTSRALRCQCPCAECVNEDTGEKMLRDETIPEWIRPRAIEPVGRYGVTIRWSDGHATGIYSFETLRANCPCEGCAKSAPSR